MLIIKLNNGRIKYSYLSSDKIHKIVENHNIPPIPNSYSFSNPKKTTMNEWYAKYYRDVDTIIDLYTETLHSFLETNDKYQVSFNIHRFRQSMIEVLYKSSYSSDKNFV